jgi:2-oxoglutarate ferredoxin oxidoreductase subunit beta
MVAPEKAPGAHPLARYLRPGTVPSTFCPGCGCGMVLNALLRAVDGLKLDPG